MAPDPEAVLVEPVDGVVGGLRVPLPDRPLVRVLQYGRVEQLSQVPVVVAALAEPIQQVVDVDHVPPAEVVFGHLDLDVGIGDRIPVLVDDLDGQRTGLILSDALVGRRLVEPTLGCRRGNRRRTEQSGRPDGSERSQVVPSVN